MKITSPILDTARNLFAYSNYLKLIGYKNKELVWEGTKDDWDKVMWAGDGVPSYAHPEDKLPEELEDHREKIDFLKMQAQVFKCLAGNI